MLKNRVKEKIRKGELAIGTYISLADPAIAEIIGLAGYDAAFIDMEHTSFDIPIVEQMIEPAIWLVSCLWFAFRITILKQYFVFLNRVPRESRSPTSQGEKMLKRW